MVSDKIIMKINAQYLIETNDQLLRKHKEKTGESVYIGVIQKNLDESLEMINAVGNSGNKQQDLIEMATHILAIITLKQPFLDGNRRTGIIATGKFLRDNGYDLDISPEEETSLRYMLKKFKEKMSTLDQNIVEQLSFYISKRMKEHESGR